MTNPGDPTGLDVYFAAQDAEVKAQRAPVTWAEFEARYTWSEPRELLPGAMVCHATSLLESRWDMTPPTTFAERERWSDGFRVIWTSHELRMILTYCEGDLDIVKCADAESYRAYIHYCAKFYGDLKKGDQ